MALPDVLFKGVPRRWTRGYTAEALRKLEPEVVVIPCVGAYSLASTVAGAGFPAKSIFACDISLYSSVIGAYLSDQDLDVEPSTERFAWLKPTMTDAAGKMAAVLLAIRILQHDKDNDYHRQHQRELITRAPVYLEQLRKAAEVMKGQLGGINYHAGDLRELIAEHRDNPKALILCNPPRYTSGYDRMFAGADENFKWPSPSVPQFTEDDYPALMEWLGTGTAPALVYYATPTETAELPPFGPPWHNVFASRPRTAGAAAINWIISNKPMNTVLHREDTVKEQPKPTYPLFTEKPITLDSDVRAVVEKAHVVDYYRDLLIHNLPATASERHYVLLIDGQLAGCAGIHEGMLRTSQRPGEVSITFAFSVRHKLYPRLHKLLLMSIVSSWWWKKATQPLEQPVTRVRTTMLTNFPEVKTARGVMTLEKRDELPDGRFRLVYGAPVIHRTVQETIAAWLGGHSEKGKREGNVKGGAAAASR